MTLYQLDALACAPSVAAEEYARWLRAHEPSPWDEVPDAEWRLALAEDDALHFACFGTPTEAAMAEAWLDDLRRAR